MEFLVDPGFFTALQDRLPHLVEHVEILPKRMKATNKLSCYRYAAVIHTKRARQNGQPRTIHAIDEDRWINFKHRGLDSSTLRQLLLDASNSRDPLVAVAGIPYNKVYLESLAGQSLSSGENDDSDDDGIKWLEPLRREAQACPSLSPLELAQLAEAADYRVEVSWARQFSQHGGLDAVFHRRDQHDQRRALFRFPTDHKDRLPHESLTNKPLLQQTKQNVHQELEARLRVNLPTYMIPQTITILERMPLNASGKVDRAALSLSITAKTEARASGAALRKPNTQMEVTMRKIWAQAPSPQPSWQVQLGQYSCLKSRASKMSSSALSSPVATREFLELMRSSYPVSTSCPSEPLSTSPSQLPHSSNLFKPNSSPWEAQTRSASRTSCTSQPTGQQVQTLDQCYITPALTSIPSLTFTAPRPSCTSSPIPVWLAS